METRLRKLEFLTKSSRILNSTLDFTELLNLIMKLVKDALDVETVSILFFDAEKRHMVFEVARGKRDKEILGLKIPVGEGVMGWVAKNEKPIVVNDLRKDQRFSLQLEKKLGLNTRSIISIPLKRRNKLIGVMEAVNRRGGHSFTEDDVEIFMALGDHIATAIENARLYREAERKRLEASLLYRISVALAKPLTLDEVLEEILNSLNKLISYDAAAIFVIDRKNNELVSHLQRGYDPDNEEKLRLKLHEGIVGWVATHKQGVIIPDVSVDSRYVNARKRTRSEMAAPMLSRGKVIGLFNLESDALNAYRGDDLRLLETFATQAGVSIERARFYEETQVKREIQRELRLARTVQQFFTHKKSLKAGPFRFAGRNFPSLELSGDYYDFFPLQKPHVAFAIADVAGKGVPASIILASFRATLRTSAPYFTSAGAITKRANQILLETVRPEDFVTAFIGVLNPETGEINYCNAGHNPPILMGSDGSHRTLESTAPVLGVFKKFDADEGTIRMDDDMLVCYTDGTTDARNARDEEFGLDRLIDCLRRTRAFPVSQVCGGLRSCLRDHVQNNPLLDDMTYLVLKREG